MRKYLVLCSLAMALLFGVSWSSAEDANTILAIYKGKAVTYADVKLLYEFRVYLLQEEVRQKYGSLAAMTKEQRVEFETACYRYLAGIVRQRLIKHLAIEDGEARGILPPPEGIKRQMDARITETMKKEVDIIRWISFLKANGYDDAPVRKVIEEDELTGFVASRTITQPDFISPSQIQEYYETNKGKWNQPERVQLRVISLAFADYNGLDGAMGKATEVVGRLAKNDSFADIAKELNKDGTGDAGGLWELREASSYNAAVQDTIANLKDGQVANPLVTRTSILIIKMEQRLPAGPKPMSEVRFEIKRILERESLIRKQDEWIQKLYKKSNVRYIDPNIKKVIDEWESAKANATEETPE
ncbi:MAG: peptidyl-prolyl cis-trans isomerase [Candidatus Brocadiia bacterium]